LDVETAWELIKEVALKRENRRRRTRAVKGIATNESDPMMEKLASDMDSLAIAVKEMNAKLTSSPRKVALVTAPCSVCDSYQHGSRECPHQPEEVSAMYQQGPSQFPRRFDNRFRTGNYFQNQSFNNPAPQRQNFSSTETDTQLLIRKFEESEARTSKRFDDFGQRIDLLSKEMDVMKRKHDDLEQAFVQATNVKVNNISAPSSSKAVHAITAREIEPVENPAQETLVQTLEEPEPEEIFIEIKGGENFKAIIEKHPRYAQFFFGFNYKKKKEETPVVNKLETKVETEEETKVETEVQTKVEDLPFPSSHVMTKEQLEDKKDKEVEDLLGKLKVNPPLLDLCGKSQDTLKYLKT